MTIVYKKNDHATADSEERFRVHKKDVYEQEKMRRENDAADARQRREQDREKRSKSLTVIREEAKSRFTTALDRAKAVTIDGEFVLPADYSLVQLLAAAFIGHPVRLDTDSLVVVVGGKRTQSVGRVYFSPTGVIVGITMKIVDGDKGRAQQLLVYGIGEQTAKWHKDVLNWHLLSPRNCTGYPHRLI